MAEPPKLPVTYGVQQKSTRTNEQPIVRVFDELWLPFNHPEEDSS
jgi:hypothetical protein